MKLRFATATILFVATVLASCNSYTTQNYARYSKGKSHIMPRLHLSKTRYAACPAKYWSGGSVKGKNKIQAVEHNTESYSYIEENGFKDPLSSPLSTFSIDVDAASYSNTRRYLTEGSLPPVDAVRIEEMINYFQYDYAQPKNNEAFAVNYELARCPWNEKNHLIHIGLQGKKIEMENAEASNLVFLLDVSGSMTYDKKLPLVKKSLKLLTNQMRPQDKISIVVYAGAAGLVLPPTSGENKQAILASLDQLEAGGSTAGGAGIQLAYKQAKESFLQDGNNRVILCTDGDFNVGMSSDGDMVRLIKEYSEDNIFLTVLGFGSGNLKDSKMEQIANKGNGSFAYIDNFKEAQKVFGTELGATLHTIAKDVKIQVEFNPAIVQNYRLIGYENRLLNDEDFNDDEKDAGELGAGHTVTAIYEIVTVEDYKKSTPTDVDPLKYQKTKVTRPARKSDEMMTVKIRHKEPKGTESKLISRAIDFAENDYAQTSNDFKFSAAVASFGMMLRDSKFKGNGSYQLASSLAIAGKGSDQNGYRSEFIELVEKAESLDLRE